MKKLDLFLVAFFATSLLSADIKNVDNPLKGERDFALQKVWEIDGTGEKLLENPGELRVSQDEMLYFHDFAQNVSIFSMPRESLSSRPPMYSHVEKAMIRNAHLYALLEHESGKTILAKNKISLPPSVF